jgi:opacity protein-like surface antigen
MKKIFSAFIIAVCCMFMAMPAQAQLLKWGVKGGVNLTKIDWDGGFKGNKDNSTGFFIGPMAEITIPIVGLGVDKKDNVDRKKTQVGLNLGAGVKLIKHLQVGVNYQFPMGDSFTWKEASKAVGAKNKTWQVSVAYLF